MLFVVGVNDRVIEVLVPETKVGAGGGSGALAAIIDPTALNALHPLMFFARYRTL